MNNNIIEFPNSTYRKPTYEAKAFKGRTVFGEFQASGTQCGHIDFVVPEGAAFKIYPLTPYEALVLSDMLAKACQDLCNNCISE